MAVAATMIAAAVANIKFIEVSKRKLRHLQTIDKVAKPCRAIKRNSIRGPDKLKIWWGKGERNEVFIMNFKEIHSNTEFLSTCRRAREIPLTGEMSRSDKRVCRIADLLLPK